MDEKITHKEYTIEFTGFTELHEKLVQMGEDFCYGKTARYVLKPAIKTALEPVATMLKANTPYDELNRSGTHMRDTVRVTSGELKAKDRRRRHVDPDAFYMGTVTVRTDKRAISQEFGNARVNAQPWIRLSLENNINQVVNRLGTYIAYRLKQYENKKGK